MPKCATVSRAVLRGSSWVIAMALALMAPGPGRAEAPPPDPVEVDFSRGPIVARVYYQDAARIAELVDFDLFEFHDRSAGYVLVAVDQFEFELLEARGFVLRADAAATADIQQTRRFDPRATGIPGFPCYRTVEETYATALDLTSQRPDLAEWIDIGDSWEKTAALGGYDLHVLKLTNTAIPGDKPKLIVTSSIHAREYTPAEISTRFAEYLVKEYDRDADVTWLLDHHEVHLMLQSNPDGRKQAETGLSWRKNTNRNYCGPTSTARGADLNRNFSFRWGCCGGSSGSACSLTYRGPSAASEPETQAIQDYLLAEFPDQRDAPLSAPAPADATGVYLDNHSYAELVLWPWGFSGSAPNGAALRTLGRRFAWFNGYTPQQAVNLYVTDGTTIDFAYGELGVAAYTWEIGTAFFQACSTFENTLVPAHLPALLYAAKVARTPYLTPAGPDALGVSVAPVMGPAAASRLVSATIDDTRTNQSNGAEPIEAIAGAEAYIDVPPWKPGAQALPLSASDGAFSSSVESVTATLDVTALGPGRHMLFVRGVDAAGNWGPFSAAFFHVDPVPQGVIHGRVTAQSSGEPIAATVSAEPLGETTQTDLTGAWSLTLPPGTWTLRASAAGFIDEVVADVVLGEGAEVLLDFALVAVPNILVVDDDGDTELPAGGVVVAALDLLELEHRVFDVQAEGREPDAFDLTGHRVVIWSSGDRGAGAGPAVESEVALGTWLDGGHCLLVSSSNYASDHGLSPFMTARLGAAAVGEDVGGSPVLGVAEPFVGLGPWTLEALSAAATDVITPDVEAIAAWSGSAGSVGVVRDTQFWRTAWLAFALEGLGSIEHSADVVGAFHDWCGALAELDPDGDVVPNAEDCAPLDPEAWAVPAPATGLRLRREPPDDLAWQAGGSPGGNLVTYDVLRSYTPSNFEAATCILSGTPATVASDSTVPDEGKMAAYLVRAVNACGGTLGQDSAGRARTAAPCP